MRDIISEIIRIYAIVCLVGGTLVGLWGIILQERAERKARRENPKEMRGWDKRDL